MSQHPELGLDHQLCFSLYRASRAVIRAYRPLLKGLGLTYPQYLVMIVLWQENEGLSVKQIGARLGLDSGTLTPLLRRLEASGHITRARDDADERRAVITLTDAGRALQDDAASIPGELNRMYAACDVDAGDLKTQLDVLGEFLPSA